MTTASSARARSPVREPARPRRRRARRDPRAVGTSGSAPRTSAIAPPWAPAFIRTDPPSVAGIATPNSSPARPWRSATPASAGSGIAPPAVSRSPSRAAHRYPCPRRSTSPGNPASDTRMFDPFPITTNGTPVATIGLAGGRQIRVGLRLQVERRRATQAERRERRERERGPDPLAGRGSQDALGARERVVSRRLPDPLEGRVAQHPHVAAAHRHDQIARADLVVRGSAPRLGGAAGRRRGSPARPRRSRRRRACP